MKKWLKSGICGFINSARMHCSPWKSQPLQLLFNKQCINNSRTTPKRVKKKKKERNVNSQNIDTASVQSKWHLVCKILKYSKIWIRPLS